MRQAAIRQADERAEREGRMCYVYLQPHPGLPVWYVRTYDEGMPDGASLEYIAHPPASDEPVQPAPPLNSPQAEED